MRFHPVLISGSLAAVVALAGAGSASAQFSTGSNTISTAVTTPTTLTGGTGTITNSGSISIGSTSVSLTISGTGTALDNFGTVENTSASTSGNPRSLLADGANLAVINEAGGVIRANSNDAVRSSTGSTSITLTNYGLITANYTNSAATNAQQAVDWNSITTGANTVNNYGTIRAYGNDAVRPGVNGIVNNYTGGQLLAPAINGSSSDGIDAQTNSGVQVTNAGLIEGGRHGVTGGNTTGTGAYAISITNQSGGTIQADNGAGLNIDGINGNELATIINSGTITGNGAALVGTNATQDGDGVDVDGLVNLTNNGTIRSLNAIGDTSEGVTVGGGTIINNAGAIIQGSVANGNASGAVGRGITIAGVDKDANGNTIPVQAPYAATTITNAGLIKGDTDSGISFTSAIASGFSHTVNNLAGGVIEGGGATAAAIQTGPDNDTINNAGRIVADASGLAIDLGGGNNALNITGGVASIVGNVSGGAGGVNTLTITPGAGNSFSYAGSFSNFNSVTVQSGTVTLTGKNTYTGTTAVANGGTLLANDAIGATGSATGSGPVSVQSGGTLGGVGRVSGDITVASGGTISPGSGGAGMLTAAGGVNVVSGSAFTFELGPDAARSDLLSIGAALSFTGSGQITVNILDNGLHTDSYTLMTFGGVSGLTASNVAFGQTPSGFAGTFNVSGTALTLNVAAVPEPSSAALLAAMVFVIGAAGVAARKKRV